MKRIAVVCGALALGLLTFEILRKGSGEASEAQLDEMDRGALEVSPRLDPTTDRLRVAESRSIKPAARHEAEASPEPVSAQGAQTDNGGFNLSRAVRETLTDEEIEIYRDEILEIVAERSSRQADALEEGVAFVDGSDRGVFVTPTHVQVFDEDGALIAEGPWVDGKRSGRWKNYSSAGQLEMEGDYVAGLAEGLWTKYGADGTVIGKVNVKAGKLHGDCRFYGDSEHENRVSGYYENGELAEAY